MREAYDKAPSICKYKMCLEVKHPASLILLHCAMASRPRRTVIQEGPDAARRFEDTMNRVLQVSKEELTRREAEYQESRRDKKSRRTHTTSR